MRCTLPSNSKWSKVSSATLKPHLAHWLNHFWTRARSKTGEVLLITKIPPNRGASGRRRSIHWILRIALVWPARASVALWRGIARGRLALKYSLNTSTAAAEEATRLWGVVCHTKKAPEMRKWVAILPLVLPLNMQSESRSEVSLSVI